MPEIDTLSARFEYMLRESHLSQVDFANRLGLSPNYMSLILNGKRDAVSGSVARLNASRKARKIYSFGIDNSLRSRDCHRGALRF
jgi:transcriptional regulator with XRE-family HTH domain